MRYYLKPIKSYLALARFRSKWRRINRENESLPNNIFPIEKVSVGKNTYATLNVYSYRSIEEKLKIGNYCSIASDVIFVLSGEHRIDCLSTYPFEEKIYGLTKGGAICRGPIVVEDDVWIGVRTTILSGVTIGKGSIIGANSIVSKSIPPYSVYAGNKIIRKRFSDNVINKLMKVDLCKINFEKYRKYCDTTITDENVEEIIDEIILRTNP